jgi:hypothetical protein
MSIRKIFTRLLPLSALVLISVVLYLHHRRGGYYIVDQHTAVSPASAPSVSAHSTDVTNLSVTTEPEDGSLTTSTPTSDDSFISRIPSSGTSEQSASVAVSVSMKSKIAEDAKHGIFMDSWSSIEGFLVDDLRRDKRFPSAPTLSGGRLDSFEYCADQANTAVRLYGYLVPPETGVYKFGVLSSNTSELWISTDEHPVNIRKVACFGCLNQEKLFPRYVPQMPRTFASSRNGSRSMSNAINLEQSVTYYFEAYLKSTAAGGFITVTWMTPGSATWTNITKSSLRFSESLADQSHSSQLPSHSLQYPLRAKYSGDDVVDSVILKGVVPECDYHPMYAYKHTVGRYLGFKEAIEASVHPDDHTTLRSAHAWAKGNPMMNAQRVQYVVDHYTDALIASQYGQRFSHLEVRLIEENYNVLHNRHDGWRYLFEADVYWKDEEKPTHISEYLYHSEKDTSKQLCSVKGFQWKRGAHVHIVLPVKNQGKWVVHVVRNLEDIYLSTGDTDFTLILVDYESNDVDIPELYKNSRLPRDMLKLISLKGSFTRTVSIQTGIDTITNPDDIILTLDLHLTMPTGFIQSIRKHTIRGKMGYTPALVRLPAGRTEHSIDGECECMCICTHILYIILL